MFPRSSHKSSGSGTIAFPDVCKVPAPPAPFVPTPYPNTQYEENLRKANDVDAKAASGSKRAKKIQEQAILNLKSVYAKSGGDEAGTLKGVVSRVNSASAAVMFGYTLHKGGVGKPLASKQTAVDMGMSKYRRRPRLR